jgi:hypothetical protein
MSDNIFKKACLVQVSSSCWIGTKRLEQGLMESIGNANWVKGQKLLVSPELLSPIKTTLHKARSYLTKIALPFPITSLHLVPKDHIESVDQYLTGVREEYWEKVEQFISFYNEARDEARMILGDLFNEADYPVNIREKFSLEWRFLALDVPTKASILSPEIYQREKQKFQELMEETKSLAMTALRTELAKLVQDISEKLTATNGGKPKIIRTSMLNGLKEFLDTYGDRNLFDDQALVDLANEARNTIAGVNGTFGFQMKHNAELRQKFAAEMDQIRHRIEESIEDLPRRSIVLEPELALAA